MKMTAWMVVALCASVVLCAPRTLVADTDDGEIRAKARGPMPVCKKSIGVGRLENKSAMPAEDVDVLRELIEDKLINSRKFNVFGLTEVGAAARARMQDAGWWLQGTVLFCQKEEVRVANPSMAGALKRKVEIELELRLVNREGGGILALKVLQADATQSRLAGDDSSLRQVGIGAMKKIARETVFWLLEQMPPTKIVSIDDDGVVIPLNGSLVEVGDCFDVYASENEDDIANRGGASAGERKVGRVCVYETGRTSSRAEPVDWVKIRNRKGTVVKACRLDSLEKGMLIRRVDEKRLAREKASILNARRQETVPPAPATQPVRQ